MKIKKIEFKKHNVFKSHSVIFSDTNDIPTTTFLVGNNGSGKTKILDTLYKSFTEPFGAPGDYEFALTFLFSDEEKTEFGLQENEVVYFLEKKEGVGNGHAIKYLSGGSTNLNLQNMSKVVFSTIEVNFNEQNISSVTSKDIDDNLKPKEISQNLSIEIPQLLVDIKNLDDADRGKWVEENQGQNVTVPKNIGTRLERFTTAFHKIYDGEKVFSHIKNDKNTKKIIFLNKDKEEIGLNELSTGEKQIIYRVGYILKNLGNIHGGIILIDEPEISLHPTWQIKLKDFLFEVFKDHDVQIIIATHSPYIFQNLNDSRESCIKIDREKAESRKISMVFQDVPYNPSVQLINYLAYGIVSELLHIELYTLLQIREKRDHIKNTSPQSRDGIEDWLQDTAGGNIPIKQTFTRTGQTNQTQETIMTWIRNKIHHTDETARPNFTVTDLKESIDTMIVLLQK